MKASPSPGAADAAAFASIDAAHFLQRIDASQGDPAPAWRELLGLWSIPADEPGDPAASPCQAPKVAGLFCAGGRQHLSLLAQFDRPLLLHMRHRTRAAWAVLLGLGPTQALLRMDGDAFIVRRVALETALDGYAAVAREPALLTLPLRRGDTGPGVEWLRHRLGETGSMKTSAPAGAYDDALAEAVRASQRDFGLHPDGVVGPETLLALLASGRDGPHLRKLPE